MPNWCDNDLTIGGSLADVTKVVELLAGIDDGEPTLVDFNKVLPIPEGEDYDARWGTKWNACHVCDAWDWQSEDEDYAMVEINFSTAWSPPIPVIDKLIELFPDCKFELRYYECGCAFQGIKNNSGHVSLDYYGSRGG